MHDLTPLRHAIVTGDAKSARAVAEQALAAGHDPLQLVTGHMAPAMDEVGRRFQCNEYFVPELLLSARAMKAAMELIRPRLAASGQQPIARIAIGTVRGDMHDIGKNLVGALLEGGGFEVIDLGANVPPERFVAAITEQKAQAVALSALLTTTMVAMKTTIDAIKAAGLRERVKVLVGGAPVTQRYADEIGADGFGNNAAEAVAVARRVLGVPA
ncbi:MAG: cobalamin-binding protein [Planctomycetes bacterium]|nr:cobalamin-binding protein [Planctomycetota bacterium]